MAIRFYDEAVVDKIKSWVKDPTMKITSPDETRRLFEYIADITDDEPIKLPLIAIRRDRTIGLQTITKNPLTFDAATLDANGREVKSLSAIPIDLKYQIDIYTRYAAEADEYVRNFVFNIINYPKIEILIPYNDVERTHQSTIRLESEITDNSDIPERLIEGQFTRFTLRIGIDDAYLWSVPIRKAWKLEIEPEIALRTDLNASLETDVVGKVETGTPGIIITEKDNT